MFALLGLNIQQCNHYTPGSSTTPETGHSSPDGNMSQHCSESEINKDPSIPSVGSLDDLSMSSSTDEENDEDDKW